MIAKLIGKLVEKKAQSLVVNVQGLCYEVLAPRSVLERVDQHQDARGQIQLITYHYLQLSQSSGIPMLIGFMNEVERDFFMQFIKVSGIGPRAAVRALNKPIAEITHAIDAGDVAYLKTLPGIGGQRAKEIVAKLQGKIGKFGLIQDQVTGALPLSVTVAQNWQVEALDVLLQLQYKHVEAQTMITKALERQPSIKTTEELLNEIYKQKVHV